MAEKRYALALHVVGVSEPILIEIEDRLAEVLPEQLPAKLLGGQIEAIEAANGAKIVVNFHHVVAAHVDTAPPLGRLYGSPERRAGSVS